MAETLKQNQGDLWLNDFLNVSFSAEATGLLTSAVKANYRGDQQQAIKDGNAAAIRFKRLGNMPGAMLSEYQVVYALRRESRSSECLSRIEALDRALRSHSYRWLEIQVVMEGSVCEGLVGRFDRASRLADSAVAAAARANYPSLQLRSLSLLASWHTQEGRFRQSWKANEEGLADFWNSVFPAERGFQLYSDLELTAEQTGLWHLAHALQREVLTTISETGRLDFQATAHLHLAIAATAIASFAEAQQEFTHAEALFKALPQTAAVRFLEADSEVGLAQLEINQGLTSDAREKLVSIGQAIMNTINFTVLLKYKKAWAALERQLADTEKEKSALQEAIAIGNQGYRTLKSDRDRWEWNHEVEQVYRRLLELEVEEPHDPLQALADWELFRVSQSGGQSSFFYQSIANSRARQHLQSRAKHFKDSTLITFAVFPHWTIVWMLDDRGVHEAHIPISQVDLKREVQDFYLLCSNPDSSLEKVKGTGLRLYKMLLQQVSSNMDQHRRLLIESDGFLSLLPWPALTTETGGYLGERYSVLEIPGLFYRRLRSPKLGTKIQVLAATPGAVTIEGDHYPLPPGADQEIEQILKLNPNAVYLRDHQVTVAMVSKLLQTASVFHFAGHAITREKGGELLMHGTTGDELFSSSTLVNLRLTNLQLVVLSACSTAMAEGEATRDPDGLVHAFLQSGARKVVASQWAVNSRSTALLMQHFYTTFTSTSDAGLALQVARRRVMNDSDFASPYYWASFELFGTVTN